MRNDDHLIFEALVNKTQGCKYAEEGCDCDECPDCKANQKNEDAESHHEQMPDSVEKAEETYGVDPEEAKAYDDARKDIDFENYPFWDAYHAVKEGAWSEDDFHQWASSVWSDGADHASHMERR